MAVSVLKRWKRFPKIPFTITGRMLGVALATSFLATAEASLAQIVSFLTSLLAVALVCAWLYRPRLVADIDRSSVLSEGDVFLLNIRIKNLATFPSYDLSFEFDNRSVGIELSADRFMVDTLDASSCMVRSLPATAVKRGVHKLPQLSIASYFPLGLFRFSCRCPLNGDLVVAPRQSLEVRNELLSKLQSETESVADHVYGHADFEYLGSHEYRAGQHVRRWDYAAWARLGYPVVREFSEARTRQFVVIVDAWKRRDIPQEPNLEQALSHAATVVSTLVAQQIPLSLLIATDAPYWIDVDNHRDHQAVLLGALAAVRGTSKPTSWQRVFEEIHLHLADENPLIACLQEGHDARRFVELADMANRSQKYMFWSGR